MKKKKKITHFFLQSSDEHLIKPYPKEMKNPVHHLRNLAIYENSVNHLFTNQNQQNGPTPLHSQLVSS